MTVLENLNGDYYCSDCGKQNGDDSIVCIKCGKSFENKKVENKSIKAPSEIGTLMTEVKEKVGGKAQILAGMIIGFFGIFITLFGLVENQGGLVLFGIFVGGLGAMMSYLGRQKVRKAEFISWVLHALALYDQSKETDKS